MISIIQKKTRTVIHAKNKFSFWLTFKGFTLNSLFSDQTTVLPHTNPLTYIKNSFLFLIIFNFLFVGHCRDRKTGMLELPSGDISGQQFCKYMII